MKKLIGSVSLVLAVATLLSVPASAASIITGDSFGTSSKEEWVTDRYDPAEFDTSGNQLYLSMGRNGYYKYRSDDKKDKYYALQGKKLATEMPSGNTWTATVKINIDNTWFSSSSNKQRAEFRVDLVDGNGKKIETSPAIALIKPGSGAPVLKFVNPKAKTGWGMGDKFVNGDRETEDLYLEEGWHTLLIKADKGILTYYIDEKKIGNCTLSTRDVYPSHMALNAYNYESPYVVNWDNCYLYDGSYIIRQRSREQQQKHEDRLEEQYEKKRQRWTDRYTEYEYNGKWYTKSELERLGQDTSGKTSKLTKEMPESYWDH